MNPGISLPVPRGHRQAPKQGGQEVIADRCSTLPHLAEVMTQHLTPLFSADQIQKRVAQLAVEIERQTPSGARLHLLTVLKGGFMFLADLVRSLSAPVTLDFVRLSSYRGDTESSGTITWALDPADVRGRHVLIVEDIVDTGLTLQAVRTRLLAKHPLSLRTVCLLDKPTRSRCDVPVEFVGFTIEDVFVVGYGLDLSERYRDLPDISSVSRPDKYRAPNRV